LKKKKVGCEEAGKLESREDRKLGYLAGALK